MSNFCFNKLYIIQSLADGDREIGAEMEADINTWAGRNGIKIQAVLYPVNTKDEWEAAWNGIYTSISDCGIIPIIHLVMHGNEKYVGLKKGNAGLIPLSELFEKARKANELSKNNIFMSMAVCEGFNLIRDITVSQHMPFCGVLASEDKLLIDEALFNFSLFYKEFFTTLNLDAAKQILQDKGKNPKLYKICKPEEVFMNAMAGYLYRESRDEKIEERAESLAKQGGIDISDPTIRAKFIEDVRKIVPVADEEYYQKFVDTFFMFDVYPEIRNRFSIPKDLNSFKTWAKSEGIDLN